VNTCSQLPTYSYARGKGKKPISLGNLRRAISLGDPINLVGRSSISLRISGANLVDHVWKGKRIIPRPRPRPRRVYSSTLSDRHESLQGEPDVEPDVEPVVAPHGVQSIRSRSPSRRQGEVVVIARSDCGKQQQVRAPQDDAPLPGVPLLSRMEENFLHPRVCVHQVQGETSGPVSPKRTNAP
jgi:hypothetical protein